MSYKDLSLEEKERLNMQQKAIIHSEEDKIFVSAGPGSGKTYTLTHKITNDLKKNEGKKGIIACSFTKESSKEIKKRVNGLISDDLLSKSFIGTLDSFVYGEIVRPFVNRFLFQCDSVNYSQVKEMNFSYPTDTKRTNAITRILDNGHKWRDVPDVENYVKKWFKKFKDESIYEVSFPSYIIAAAYFLNLPDLTRLFSSKYSCIYIDEAQDLNAYQHYLIDTISDKCGLKVLMIGDGNQSIYEFRGAKPQIFNSLPSRGFKEYNIDVSVRCHHSILALSYSLFDNERIYEILENRVFLDEVYSDITSLVSSVTNVFVLVESKSRGKNLLREYIDKNIEIIYTESLPYDDNPVLKLYKDQFMELIEETLFYYFNCKNIEGRYVYSSEEYIDKLYDLGYVNERFKSKEVIKRSNESFGDYLSRILKIVNTKCPNDLINEISLLIEDEIYSNHYYLRSDINRIMTIHSSKGLESDTVVVLLEYDFSLNSSTKRKYFVAFSRAKNKLYINFTGKALNSRNRDFIVERMNSVGLIHDKIDL